MATFMISAGQDGRLLGGGVNQRGAGRFDKRALAVGL